MLQPTRVRDGAEEDQRTERESEKREGGVVGWCFCINVQREEHNDCGEEGGQP